MNSIRIIIVLLLTVVSSSCQFNNSNPPGESVKFDPGRYAPLPETTPFTLRSNIAPKSIYDSTDHLQMEILITNTSDDSITVITGSGGSVTGDMVSAVYFDFIVLRTDSTLIYRRLAGRGAVALGTTNFYLAPGQRSILDDDWDLTNQDGEMVKKGTYLVYAGIESLGYSQPYNSSKENRLGMIRTGPPDTLIVK